MNKFHWTAPPMTEERFEKLKEWAEETKQPEILSYVKEMDRKILKRSLNSCFRDELVLGEFTSRVDFPDASFRHFRKGPD